MRKMPRNRPQVTFMTELHHMFEFIAKSGLTYKMYLSSNSSGGVIQIQVAGDYEGWALLEFPGKFQDAQKFYDSVRTNASWFQDIIDYGFDGFVGPLHDRAIATSKIPGPTIAVPPFIVILSSNANSGYCSIDGCRKVAIARGLCEDHEPRGRLALEKFCSVPNCRIRVWADSLCRQHYDQKLPEFCRSVNGSFKIEPEPRIENPELLPPLPEMPKITEITSEISPIPKPSPRLYPDSVYSLFHPKIPESYVHAGGQPKITGTCVVPGCDKPIGSRSMCGFHYRQDYKSRYVPKFKFCTIIGCDQKAVARGLCGTHIFYNRLSEIIQKTVPEYLAEIGFDGMLPEIPNIDDIGIESDGIADEWHEAFQLHAFPIR